MSYKGRKLDDNVTAMRLGKSYILSIIHSLLPAKLDFYLLIKSKVNMGVNAV